MLDDETAGLLRGGCALILGAVASDGRPMASRGWGVEVVTRHPLCLRILVDGHEQELVDLIGPSARVAVTAADVPTLRSVQFKGRSRGVENAGPRAAEVMSAYVEQFFDDITETDGTPREVLVRALPDPADLVAVAIDVDETFDQTPGPSAGRSVVAP